MPQLSNPFMLWPGAPRVLIFPSHHVDPELTAPSLTPACFLGSSSCKTMGTNRNQVVCRERSSGASLGKFTTDPGAIFLNQNMGQPASLWS